MRWVRGEAALALVALAAAGVVAASAAPAAAHPFGTPPVARVTAEGTRVDVRWSVAPDDVVALGYQTGAIPSQRTFVFEDGVPVDVPGEVEAGDAELVATSPAVSAYLTDRLRVLQDGRDCDGRVVDASDLDGDGAHLAFTCPATVETVELDVTLLHDIDPAYRTAVVGEGTATSPRGLTTREDPTHTVTFGGGGSAVGEEGPPRTADRQGPAVGPTGPVDPLGGRLVALFDGSGVAALTILAAVAVGSAHALAPGHGKTVAAAYLVGTRARGRDAVALGVTVAVMHTASVLAIGLGWYALAGGAGGGIGVLTAWLQLVAALVVMAVGVGLVRRRRRGGDDGHEHDHAHPHPPAPADTSPWSVRGLVALGVSGGLLPSPSAFLVLVTGLFTGRVVLALVVVVAFGVGMAVTLSVVGWATVRGRDLLADRRWPAPAHRLVRALPGLAAVAVLAGGCVMSVLAVVRLAAT